MNGVVTNGGAGLQAFIFRKKILNIIFTLPFQNSMFVFVQQLNVLFVSDFVVSNFEISKLEPKLIIECFKEYTVFLNWKTSFFLTRTITQYTKIEEPNALLF